MILPAGSPANNVEFGQCCDREQTMSDGTKKSARVAAYLQLLAEQWRDNSTSPSSSEDLSYRQAALLDHLAASVLTSNRRSLRSSTPS